MGIYICKANEHSRRYTKNYKYTIEKWFEKEDLLAQCSGHKSEWSFIY